MSFFTCHTKKKKTQHKETITKSKIFIECKQQMESNIINNKLLGKGKEFPRIANTQLKLLLLFQLKLFLKAFSLHFKNIFEKIFQRFDITLLYIEESKSKEILVYSYFLYNESVNLDLKNTISLVQNPLQNLGVKFYIHLYLQFMDNIYYKHQCILLHIV